VNVFLRPTSPRLTLLRDAILIVIGCALQAASVVVFLNPANLAAGGVSGLALILSRILPFNIPVGILTLLLNLPLFVLGLRLLGGWAFLARTIVTSVLYSLMVAGMEWLGVAPVTGDIILNTLFGSIIGGIGMGLVFLARATTGGTDILALLLVRWRSIPLSQSYIITDALVVALAGVVFGWDKALYALISLYVTGIAAEGTSEGANISRMALIITEAPDAVSRAIMHQMGRGLTRWNGRGGFTDQERPILMVVISRAETAVLKSIVAAEDSNAFVVIGQAQEVYGEGFRRFDH
jgi:uncharacterized membrane-anchored protein YitT (DUF2179 family)